MTPEARLEMHEQWLQSLDSYHHQITEDLAKVAADLSRVERAQAQFAEHMVVVGQNQALFAVSLAKLTEEVRELRETVDRYIRSRGDGNQPK